jgi:putative CocE/NonD family hydrolase
LIDEIETAWIPMKDGRRLAARLFLPKAAGNEPAPVIIEYIPYRRRDGTRLGDEAMHRWFAGNGYACARVDIAGSGDSDGLLDDEYVQREQDDGLQVIEWLAAQPWSSGVVGIIGISWGGFNGLQIAARRPPALKAVISLCSVVDRYHGDVHYSGGCLNEENLEWGGCLFTMHAFPPDPAIVGEDRWRDLWRQRIEAAPLPPAEWLEHQRRDAFWQHGSVVGDYSDIDVPVLAISGWADGYTAAVPALVEHLGPSTKGIIGPWGHKYPHDGVPGPAIGFLQEATRWWDHWLKGIDTGVQRDPAMRIWLQQSHHPQAHIPERGGTWIGSDTWPLSEPPISLALTNGRLMAAETITATWDVNISSPVTTGLAGGQWCAYGQGKIAPELALDQRTDDMGSLVYDGDVLSEPIHLVGAPIVHLQVASDKPHAMIAVRLSAVHAAGAVERLTYGVLNLCHRDSHATPALLEPGKPYCVTVEMKPIAQTVEAGQCLRLSISTAYWPMIWPSPELATLTIEESASHVELPIQSRVASLSDDLFGPAVAAGAGDVTVLRDGSESRRIIRDLGERRTEFVAARDDGRYVLDDIGTELTFTRVRSSTIVDDEPLSATARYHSTATFHRHDWDCRVESEITMTCSAESFHLDAQLTAHDGGQLFAERTFHRTIPRDHV